jgi:hypothetical protein
VNLKCIYRLLSKKRKRGEEREGERGGEREREKAGRGRGYREMEGWVGGEVTQLCKKSPGVAGEPRTEDRLAPRHGNIPVL